MSKILVNTDHLAPELRDALSAACDALCVGAEFCAGDALHSRLPELEVPAVLAVLPSGERTLSDRLRRAMDAAPRSTRLVLLCEESLIDGRAALADGRLVLLGSPHSSEKLRSSLRWCATLPAVSTEHTASVTLGDIAPQSATDRTRMHFTARESQRERYWLGVLESNSGPAWSLEQDARGVRVRCEGESSAALALDLDLSTWRLAPPADSIGAWLISERRFPPVWDALHGARARRAEPFELSAAEGDLVCLVRARSSAAAESETPWSATAEFFAAVELGGAAALAFLARELSTLARAHDALILEVR